MTITGLKAKLTDQTEKTEDKTLNSFKDATEASAWAKSSLADSLRAGILAGRDDSELAPKEYITRAEVAAIVERLLQKSDLI
ncbi:S-layer homology domain-containing protein [Paenibacillus hexagrammi]|uniref:S-layer homology domain-containing protein n=2 Tax=Paenibacillus hexagrammi TaxID=2908839 RepID=A0ABY3SRZ8_9BACL|nr:S-layer homology domain-containing protein [Paenibacillus sp. YPD9-1]